MGILNDLTVPVKLPKCKVRATLESLEPDDKAILAAALTNPAWKPAPLADALLSRGISLDRQVITRHRQGLCSCPALGNS